MGSRFTMANIYKIYSFAGSFVLLLMCLSVVMLTIRDVIISPDCETPSGDLLDGSAHPSSGSHGLSIFTPPSKGQILYVGIGSLLKNSRKICVSSVMGLGTAYVLSVSQAGKTLTNASAFAYVLVCAVLCLFFLSLSKCYNIYYYDHSLNYILSCIPSNFGCQESGIFISEITRAFEYSISYLDSSLVCAAVVSYFDFFVSIIGTFYSLFTSSSYPFQPVAGLELIFDTIIMAKIHFLYTTRNSMIVLDCCVHMMASILVILCKLAFPSSKSKFSFVGCCLIRGVEAVFLGLV